MNECLSCGARRFSWLGEHHRCLKVGAHYLASIGMTKVVVDKEELAWFLAR